MFKVSKMADYAVIILSMMGDEDPSIMLSSAFITEKTKLPEPTVAKLMKLLNKGGVVESVRGAHGGYRLARPVSQITITQVIEAIDGDLAITACVDGGLGECSFSQYCTHRGLWDGVNNAIRGALDGITLADMAPCAAAGVNKAKIKEVS